MSDYYQFRDETGTPIDYYQLVDDNNELCKEIKRLQDMGKILRNENINLKLRINKAIEYINKNGIIDLNGYDLLEILGSDKE